MSALAVRTGIKDFLIAEFPSETFLDLTGQYDTIERYLAHNGINRNDTWIGIQFIGTDEIPVALSANNTQGCYREFGIVILHIVGIASLGVGDAIVNRAEAIRNKLRGQRIGNIIIDSVSPPNFDVASTLRFEGGYIAAAINADYKYDLSL